MRPVKFPVLVIACFYLLLEGCGARAPEHSQRPTLYDELGQQAGIDQLNERLILLIAADGRINHFFKGADIDRFHRMLGEHLCGLSDGPCEYTGDTMRLVHAGMGVDNAAFNAVVENLILAMEKEGIAVAAQNRLLQRLAPLHGEIVDAPLPEPFAPSSDMSPIDAPAAP